MGQSLQPCCEWDDSTSPGSPSGAAVWLGQTLFPCYATWQDSVRDQCLQPHSSGSRGPAHTLPCHPALPSCLRVCHVVGTEHLYETHSELEEPTQLPRSPAATVGATQKHRCGRIGLPLPYHSALGLEVIMATSPPEALGVFNSHIWVQSSLSHSERLIPVHKQWVTPYPNSCCSVSTSQ